MANEPEAPRSPAPAADTSPTPRKRKRTTKRRSTRGTPVTTPRGSTSTPNGDNSDSDDSQADPGPSLLKRMESTSSKPPASKKRSKPTSRNGGPSTQSQSQSHSQSEPQAQTLPSSSQPSEPPPPPPPFSPPPLPPSSSQSQTQPPKTSFEDNDDFIAFTLGSDDEVFDMNRLAPKGQRNQISGSLTGKEIALAKVAAGRSRREERAKEEIEKAVQENDDNSPIKDAKPDDSESRDRKDKKRDEKRRHRDRDRSRDSGRSDYSDRDSRRRSRKGKEREMERDLEPEDRDHRRNSKRRGDNDDAPPEREWDRGKPRERDRRDRDRDHDRDRDRKRKRDRDPSPDPEDAYFSQGRWVNLNTRKTPWVHRVDWDKCKNAAEMLHYEVEAFVKWISPSPVEDEIRGLVVQTISRAVESTFPDAQVLPFGSYETKLYLPLGDIDLVIISNSMAYSNKTNVLHSLAQTIKRSGISDRVTIIAKAKVPIIKFITTHGRFNVDISVNQDNGLRSGQIINGFLRDLSLHNNAVQTTQEPPSQKPNKKANGRDKHRDDPIPSTSSNNPINETTLEGSLALRSLVLITKAFLSQRQMNEVFTGGLGSYSIVCLAVSFLQMHPKIRRGEIDAEKNLGVLVMEFFELYGCYFNYEEVGISLRDGGTYFSKRKRGWFNENGGGGRGGSGMLTIEDPADPSNDISKGSYAFPKVRATFAGAYNILTATAFLRAGVINSRRNDRSVRLRNGGSQPEDFSILSSVLTITQETINHRKLVQELYDKRILHNILGVAPRAQPQPPSVDFDSTPRAGGHSSHAKTPSSHGGAQSVELAWREADGDAEEEGEAEPEEIIYDGSRSKRKSSSSSKSKSKSKSKSSRHHERDEDEDEDEDGGRYGISREPHKKRRRTDRNDHAPTVYTTDDDDDDHRGTVNAKGKDKHPRNSDRARAREHDRPSSSSANANLNHPEQPDPNPDKFQIHTRVDSGSADMDMSEGEVAEEKAYAAGGASSDGDGDGDGDEKRKRNRSYWLSKGLGGGGGDEDGDEYEYESG